MFGVAGNRVTIRSRKSKLFNQLWSNSFEIVGFITLSHGTCPGATLKKIVLKPYYAEKIWHETI